MSGVDLDKLRDIFAPLFAEELGRAKENAGQSSGQKTGFFEEAPGVKSVRRLIFFAAFVFGVGMCIAGIWLPVNETVAGITKTIVISAFGVMGAGRIAEMFENRNDGGGL